MSLSSGDFDSNPRSTKEKASVRIGSIFSDREQPEGMVGKILKLD
jgi:hypothetical protein